MNGAEFKRMANALERKYPGNRPLSSFPSLKRVKPAKSKKPNRIFSMTVKEFQALARKMEKRYGPHIRWEDIPGKRIKGHPFKARK